MDTPQTSRYSATNPLVQYKTRNNLSWNNMAAILGYKRSWVMKMGAKQGAQWLNTPLKVYIKFKQKLNIDLINYI